MIKLGKFIIRDGFFFYSHIFRRWEIRTIIKQFIARITYQDMKYQVSLALIVDYSYTISHI